MAAMLDALDARAPDAVDRARARGEYPAIEQSRIVGARESRMSKVERDNIGGVTGGQSGGDTERLRSAVHRMREQIGADERRCVAREKCACALCQTLRIFERAKLLRCVDED